MEVALARQRVVVRAMVPTEELTRLTCELVASSRQGFLNFSRDAVNRLELAVACLEYGGRLYRVVEPNIAFVDFRIETCERISVACSGASAPGSGPYSVMVPGWHPEISIWEDVASTWVDQTIRFETLVDLIVRASSLNCLTAEDCLPEPQTMTCWFASVPHKRQLPEWCVPTCVAMLANQFASPLPDKPAYYAELWGQCPGQRFLEASMGRKFASYLGSYGATIQTHEDFADFFGRENKNVVVATEQKLSFSAMCEIDRPFMIARNNHATVVRAATKAQFSTASVSVDACHWLNPEDSYPCWYNYSAAPLWEPQYLLVAPLKRVTSENPCK